ncbi:hypothetical protein BSKO_05302 [Bryopsis sp. KO-2023]|nr:hypothetical protein BSKO_05302 [Bryopsis sp. KO-2023]
MGQCAGKPNGDGTINARAVSYAVNGGAAEKQQQHHNGEGQSKKPEAKAVDSGGASKVANQFGLDFLVTKHMLGEGGSGETWLMEDSTTKELVAVKLIKRPIPKVLHEMLLHEIQIQSDLGGGHTNIVNAREVVLTNSHLALILEYASGGTLTKYVSDRWDTVQDRGGLFLAEDEALFFFKQFISAVEYCHKHSVAHRDLKLDNTLLDSSKPPFIKICDFGFAKNFDEDANMHTHIGTPVYMSPELISSKRGRMGYDGRKADVWASGVMLFVMLLGMFPYEHSEHPDPNTSAAQIEVWLQQIKSKWRENARVRDAAAKLSPECQDMLDHIFDLNEKRRMSVEDIKAHPWFQRKLDEEKERALGMLLREQGKISCDVQQKTAKTRKRDEMLKTMLSVAARVGNPGDSLMRVGLAHGYPSTVNETPSE